MSGLTLFPQSLAAQAPAPEPVRTAITVVGKIAAETPASVTVLDHSLLERSPGVDLDDQLHDLPGFSLFRRTSSLVAHPTTQGVSLRGIGSSGASRTLVLWDGVPVNDPFGGWVYWTRFSPDELERVEVSGGASASAFGDRAMGGVIALVSREPLHRHLYGRYQGGNRNTQELAAGLSNLWTRWAASANLRAFTTAGYFIVPDPGPVDRWAGVRFLAGDARLDYLGRAGRLFLKLDLLAESRRNGTLLQTNSTGLGTLSAHYSHAAGISVVAYHTREQFHSTFSSVAADRGSERLAYRQTVPAQAAGGAAFWQRRAGRFDWLAGGDLAHTEGYSKDALFPSGLRVGGGALLQHGLFAQTAVDAGLLRLFAGARHDFTGRGQTFLSPNAGLLAGRKWWRARGSVYRGFRAPTLNELFRDFRVGNAVTQANPALIPERLFGAEAGFDARGERLRASLTFYRSSLTGLITNVTLTSSPNLIVRQRQNAAAALARGFQFDSQAHWGPLRTELGYLFADSRFATGARIPQVPRHQGSARLGFEHRGALAWLDLRSYGSQFEDELNTRNFLLPGYASVQLMLRQRLARGLSAVLAMENLLDRRYLVGFTPNPNIGPPRLWRAGLHWEGQY